MSALDFLLPWDSQPQDTTPANESGFLRDAKFLWHGGNAAQDMASGGLVASSGYSATIARDGRTASSSGSGGNSDTISIPNNSLNADWSKPFTLVWVGRLLATGFLNGYDSLMGDVGATTSTVGLAIWGAAGASRDKPYFETWSSGGTQKFTPISSQSVLSQTEYTVLVATSDTVNLVLYMNGVQVSTVATAGALPGTNTQTFKIGARTAGKGAAQEVLLSAALNGCRTAAEVAEFTKSIWAGFAPRSIWVPVSAGGGTTYTLPASAGAYTLSGQAATIERNRALTADAGSYTLAGQAATIAFQRAMVAASGAYVLSGQAATITRNRAIVADPGAYTLAGQNATITYTPISGSTYTLPAAAGAYTLSGQAAAILYGRLLSAGSGAYALAGSNATLTYTPAALPTIGRPASDASNAGWAASTGSDLYAMLDEVTPDSADYIVTTSTGSICEMPLQTTAYPGTASQVLSYRASSSTGNSVIVRLKNTGGATVRSETQVLTASDTLYQITLTAPEIAAITSGALSVELESA